MTENQTFEYRVEDESGFCRHCSDILPHCSSCEYGIDGEFVCLECM